MRTNKYLEAIKEYLSSKDMSYCNCGKNQDRKTLAVIVLCCYYTSNSSF